MATPIEIRWAGSPNLNSQNNIQTAKDYFEEWAGEGGLTEAFNGSLQASQNLNVYLSDSGADYLVLTVLPGWKQPDKKSTL